MVGNGNNKDSMEDEIRFLVKKVYDGEMSDVEAANKILVLFGVVGQSEQLLN